MKLPIPWRPRFRFSLRALLILTAIAPAFIYYWVTLPQRTWQEFLVAAKEHDVARMNAICDDKSLRFDTFSFVEPPEGFALTTLRVIIRSPGGEFSRPCPHSELLSKPTRPRSLLDYLLGRQTMGHAGDIMFGHLEVHRYHVVFKEK